MIQYQYIKIPLYTNSDELEILNEHGSFGYQLVHHSGGYLWMMREIPNPKEKNDEPKLEFIRVPEQTYPVTTDNGEARSHRNY